MRLLVLWILSLEMRVVPRMASFSRPSTRSAPSTSYALTVTDYLVVNIPVD
jgi:hypothetical protein